MPNGHTVVADNGTHQVVELDENDKVVWSFDVPNDNKRPTPTMRQVRRLDNGNTLICASTEDKVMEVSPDKKVVWSYDLPFPYLATRLENGHTIISSGDGYGSKQGFFVIEVDKDGKTVWKYGGTDAPADQKLNWPSGFVRLANGDTLISEAHGRQIREVSADKKTVKIIKSDAMRHPCTLVVVDEWRAAYAARQTPLGRPPERRYKPPLMASGGARLPPRFAFIRPPEESPWARGRCGRWLVVACVVLSLGAARAGAADAETATSPFTSMARTPARST